MTADVLTSPRTAFPTSPAASHSVRAVLRQRTQAVHERLHRVPAFAALAAGRLTRGGYHALLGRLLGFHEPMEEAVAASLPDLPFGPAAWRRSGLLRQDLACLGSAAQAIAALPRLAAPPISDPAVAMGCLYVMEGSTLGGRMLAARLDAMLDGADGRRFLSAGGGPGHVRWTGFCAALERVADQPGGTERALAGAGQTFASFERWFADAA